MPPFNSDNELYHIVRNKMFINGNVNIGKLGQKFTMSCEIPIRPVMWRLLVMILSRRSQYCMISKTPQICRFIFNPCMLLTHWGRVTQICVGKLTIIDSDNGLSPGRRQAIIWTNAGILLIGLRGTSFSEILIGTQAFSFKKMHLKMSSAKGRPICLGLNVLS